VKTSCPSMNTLFVLPEFISVWCFHVAVLIHLSVWISPNHRILSTTEKEEILSENQSLQRQITLALFKDYTDQLIDIEFLFSMISFFCKILLPTSIERHTVLKSPHIYKKHRAQYEVRTHARMLQVCITIESFSCRLTNLRWLRKLVNISSN